MITAAVFKYCYAGNVTSIGGNRYRNYADGLGTSALFYAPCGLSVDLVGNIYAADNGNNRIRKISSSGTYLAVVAVVFARAHFVVKKNPVFCCSC